MTNYTIAMLTGVWAMAGCVVAVASPVPSGAGQEGLIGHWSFDEGQGDVVVDRSGQAHDGEVWNGQWVRGSFGTALRFDGQGGHVTIPQLAQLDESEQLTVEAWVYWEGTSQYPNIVTGGTWSPGGFLFFVSNQQCSFRMGRPGYSATAARSQWRETSAPLLSSIETGRWYHLAATFRRPQITTYVDGRQVGSATWDYPVGYQGDLLLGKWSGTGGHQGLIDEVKIFNRALSAEQVAEEYRAQAAGRETPRAGQRAYEQIPRQSQLDRAAATFENDHARLAISPGGRCTALIDKHSGEDRILRTTPLVTVRVDGATYQRSRCRQDGNRLLFSFDQIDTTVVLNVESHPSRFLVRVESVSNPSVDQVTFVQLNLKPCTRVNTMSGLAADERFAVCLRALNLHTEVRVAGQTPRLTATADREFGLLDAQAAIVTCPADGLIPALQELVRQGGLPPSPLGGPFAREAELNRGSYVFASVSEGNAEQWIELARRGGLSTIHMSGWEQSLGHYVPREDLFPHGLEGLKAVVDRFHAAGLRVGIHTLTGCISPHDPWVRPVPDPRLATDGTFTLAADLNETDTQVPTLEPPGDYPTVWAYSSRGNCIRIDDELILYSRLANDGPYYFGQCQRGAFGTKVAPHGKGASLHHLVARYGCFIPDEHSTLVDEVADRIAHVYNTGGLDQIYMDGAEAMRGWYGIARMRNAIYTRLQRPALVEASCWDHHSWPFHSRVGAWDHPKWGLKRFADDHLQAVQQYRDEFLLEGQLGWWVLLGPARDWDQERPDEIEYLCVKALAHDVPLSFQNVAVDGEPPTARQAEYLTTIGRCERLRLANYFDEAVRTQLRQERAEFHLRQADDGQWELVPTDYLRHKVTAAGPDPSGWTVANRFGSQPVRFRIQALDSALPYDDPQGVLLADGADAAAFGSSAAASSVQLQIASGPGPPGGPAGSVLQLSATNNRPARDGSWARAEKTFQPVVDLTACDALGLWVHGDGQGGLLNVQLTNLPEYFQTLDDHYVRLDFEGWRYFELLLRERDAAAYHDYSWPYGAHCVLHRSPLVRPAVNRLTLYLNNLLPERTTNCCVGPIRAIRTQKVRLHHPTLAIGDRSLVLPVDLESGMMVEFDACDNCRLYDERGQLIDWVHPSGDVPVLEQGDNIMSFSCTGPDNVRLRAEVTVLAAGEPIRGRRAPETINRQWLRAEYEPPRTILALDGHQNMWDVLCRADEPYADLEIELEVQQIGSPTAAYDADTAVTLESFEPRESEREFVYDTSLQAAGCSPGVQQMLAPATDIVRVGHTSGRYTATSNRDDNGGWSFKGRRLDKALDVTDYAAIGFWLYGDGGGQLFKLQLHDAAGGWQDMYTRVDFQGWRYCQFQLGGATLKDPTRVDAVNVYYNGLPGRRTVACYLDEIRWLQPVEPLRDPTVTVANSSIRFPTALDAGDRLVTTNRNTCTIYRHTGARETVRLPQPLPRLQPGRHSVRFDLPAAQSQPMRVVVSVSKRYGKAED